MQTVPTESATPCRKLSPAPRAKGWRITILNFMRKQQTRQDGVRLKMCFFVTIHSRLVEGVKIGASETVRFLI
jgi:hypothetical protein